MSHTPGPWTNEGLEVWTSPDCRAIAYCSGEANARLIAAAPDMLAALKEAKDCLEIFSKHAWPDWKGDATPASCLGVVRAAIDKATRGD